MNYTTAPSGAVFFADASNAGSRRRHVAQNSPKSSMLATGLPGLGLTGRIRV